MSTNVKSMEEPTEDEELWTYISLMSTVRKTMERLVTNCLRYFAELMHLLTECQAGL